MAAISVGGGGGRTTRTASDPVIGRIAWRAIPPRARFHHRCPRSSPVRTADPHARQPWPDRPRRSPTCLGRDGRSVRPAPGEGTRRPTRTGRTRTGPVPVWQPKPKRSRARSSTRDSPRSVSISPAIRPCAVGDVSQRRWSLERSAGYAYRTIAGMRRHRGPCRGNPTAVALVRTSVVVRPRNSTRRPEGDSRSWASACCAEAASEP